MPKFLHHPCESAVPTSDDNNFPIQTLIYTSLDSTKISLSLEFYKMKCLAKPWAGQWAGSWTVDERSILVFKTFVFKTGLYLKRSELRMA